MNNIIGSFISSNFFWFSMTKVNIMFGTTDGLYALLINNNGSSELNSLDNPIVIGTLEQVLQVHYGVVCREANRSSYEEVFLAYGGDRAIVGEGKTRKRIGPLNKHQMHEVEEGLSEIYSSN